MKTEMKIFLLVFLSAFKSISIKTDHKERILCITVLKDGTIATGSNDSTIKIWDPSNSQLIRTLQDHRKKVTSLVVLKDENLASSSTDATIKIWNTKNGSLVKTLKKSDIMIHSLVVLADNTLASGLNDGRIEIWNILDDTIEKKLKKKSDPILALLALSHETLASSSKDKIDIWNFINGSFLRTLDGHKPLVLLDNDRFLSKSSEYMKIWDINSNILVKKWQPANRDEYNSLLDLKDGTIAIGLASRIEIWNIETEPSTVIRTLNSNSESISCLAVLSNISIVSSCSRENQTIRIWNLNDKSDTFYAMHGHKESVTSLIVLENNLLASGSLDNTVRIWNTTSRKLFQIFPKQNDNDIDYVFSLALLDDKILVAGSKKEIKILSIEDNKIIKIFAEHSDDVKALITLKNGYFASASSDKLIQIWHKDEIISIKTLNNHKKEVTSLVILNDNKFASGSEDQTIIIWSTVDYLLIRQLLGANSKIWCIGILLDGSLVSGSEDGAIRIWNAETGLQLKELKENSSEDIFCLTVLQDGTIASGSRDHKIKIWDTNTRKVIRTINEYNNMIYSLAVLKDGSLVSGSNKDWSIKIWKLTDLTPSDAGIKGTLNKFQSSFNALIDIVLSLVVLFKYKRNSFKNNLTHRREVASANNYEQTELPLCYQNLKIISKTDVLEKQKIGNGKFGEVIYGFMKKNDGFGKVEVAIKKLLNMTSESQFDLIDEARVINKCDHANLVKCYGVCLNENIIDQIIMEYMNCGDLLEYLRKSQTLSYNESIKIAVDILKGCEYLEQKNIIHRDLAARNCLLAKESSNRLIVKLGDFGLAKSNYFRNYCRITCFEWLPMRWLAPESINYGIFSNKSDVWSFGIVIWEIFSKGIQPYRAMTNQEVVNFVTDKGTHDFPKDCPIEIMELMIVCSKYNREERPTFKDILTQFNSKALQHE